MKYYKFINKESGRPGVLPEKTINSLLENPKRTIEVLFECDADGNPLPQQDGAPEQPAAAEDVNAKDDITNDKPQQDGAPEQPAGTKVHITYVARNDWGGDAGCGRTEGEEPFLEYGAYY